MRKRFEPQITLGCTPIGQVAIPADTRAHMANLMEALQFIYTHPKWNRRIFELLADKITADKQATGRKGMSLWEIFVLSQVRLCLNISYDELRYRANYDLLLRGILGVLPTDYSAGKQYEYQNIYDNVKLIDEQLLRELNDVIVEIGHGVFKKKEAEPLRVKTDSFVVETDIHYPTDYNLLWDSGRKCIRCGKKLDVGGWRKSADWHKKLKGLMRAVGKAHRGGGRGRVERIRKAAEAYLKKAKALEKKVQKMIDRYFQEEAEGEAPLIYYQKMLTKHIDLVERRLVKGEKIPHAEKVFSIFLNWTELIKKGKRRPPVEFGKKLTVTTDQYHLITDWHICDRQADSELTVPIARRLAAKYPVESLSTDKGFSDMGDKKKLEKFIGQVIMPKKGRRTGAQKKLEEAPAFKRLKNKHNAIESNINELEHRGLDRCPNRNWPGFERYVGLGVTAYNLHKIGRELLRQKRAQARRRKAA
jgi:hypothetical protein